jgi:hypothetical protein
MCGCETGRLLVNRTGFACLLLHPPYMRALSLRESFFLFYFYRFVYHLYNSFLSDFDAIPDFGALLYTDEQQSFS